MLPENVAMRALTFRTVFQQVSGQNWTAVTMAKSGLYDDRNLSTFSQNYVIGDTVLSEIHESCQAGESAIWLHDDPVHLTPAMYAAVEEDMAKVGDSAPRTLKRARSESVGAQAKAWRGKCSTARGGGRDVSRS